MTRYVWLFFCTYTVRRPHISLPLLRSSYKQVAIMFLTSVWILSKSAFVEGILDGSRLADGKPVTVRNMYAYQGYEYVLLACASSLG